MTFLIVIVIIIIVMIFTGKLERIYELAALVTMKVRRTIQAVLKPLGITMDQFGTLLALSRGDGISQRELARIMETDTTTAMVICEGLEKRGLITRTRSPEDRRVNRLEISEKGRELLGRAYAAVAEGAAPLTKALSDQEADVLAPLLEKLADTAREMAASAKRGLRARREE